MVGEVVGQGRGNWGWYDVDGGCGGGEGSCDGVMVDVIDDDGCSAEAVMGEPGIHAAAG